MATIVIFTRLRAQPGRAAALRDAFDSLVASAAREPGTLVFAVHEAADDPDLLLCYEAYRDDAALAEHRASGAVRDAVDRFGDLVAEPPAVTYARYLAGPGVPFA